MARVLAKTLAASMIALAAGIAAAGEAEQSWKGRISDSMCGVSHMTSADPSGKTPTDGDCVRSCVKDGSAYIFVTGGKVFAIEDQAFPGLDENAGRDVTVYGKMNKDSIRISRLTPND
jgi:hypothetical protein